MQQTTAPLSNIKWLEQEYPEAQVNLNFNEDKGLYTWKHITGFNKMMSFNERQNTILGKITKQI